MAAQDIPVFGTFVRGGSYPTHEARYSKGGKVEVANASARLAIPANQLVVGMLATEQDTALSYQLIDLTPTWTPFTSGSSATSLEDLHPSASSTRARWGKYYGFVGDNTTDNNAAFVAFLADAANVDTLFLAEGTYYVDTASVTAGWNYSGRFISWTKSNLRIVGVGKVTIRCSAEVLIVFSGTITNVAFEDVHFQSDGTVTPGVYGILTCDGNSIQVSIDGLRLSRCDITAPLAGNGIQFLAVGVGVIKNVLVEDTWFHDIGRMGIEMQNSTHDTTARIRDITIRNNRFSNSGLQAIAGTGQGVSFNRYGENRRVEGNLFENVEFGAVEFREGSYDAILNNRFRDFQSRGGTYYSPITITNDNSIALSYGLLIQGNQEIEIAASATVWRLTGMKNCIASENVILNGWWNIGTFRGSVIQGNHIQSSYNYALYFSGPTTANKVIGNILDTTTASSPFSVVRFDGSNISNNCTGSTVTNNDLIYTAGSAVDQIQSAVNNDSYLNTLNKIIPESHVEAKVFSATPTFNAAAGLIKTMTLTANVTAWTNNGGTTGQRMTIYLTQGGAGGFTISGHAGTTKIVGGVWTLSASAGAVDCITLLFDGTNWNEVGRGLALQ